MIDNKAFLFSIGFQFPELSTEKCFLNHLIRERGQRVRDGLQQEGGSRGGRCAAADNATK
jgi:hypothetical protein